MNQKSYTHGPSLTPLLGETIGDNLRNTCMKYPDRDALVSVHQDYKVSYKEFWEQVTTVAKHSLL